MAARCHLRCLSLYVVKQNPMFLRGPATFDLLACLPSLLSQFWFVLHRPIGDDDQDAGHLMLGTHQLAAVEWSQKFQIR